MSLQTDAILAKCRHLPPIRTAVVHPSKANVLQAVDEAVRAGLIEPVLIGPRAKTEAAAAEAGVSIGSWQVIETEHSHAAAEKGLLLEPITPVLEPAIGAIRIAQRLT